MQFAVFFYNVGTTRYTSEFKIYRAVSALIRLPLLPPFSPPVFPCTVGPTGGLRSDRGLRNPDFILRHSHARSEKRHSRVLRRPVPESPRRQIRQAKTGRGLFRPRQRRPAQPEKRRVPLLGLPRRARLRRQGDFVPAPANFDQSRTLPRRRGRGLRARQVLATAEGQVVLEE